MTLESTVLKSLAERRPDSGGTLEIKDEASGWSLRVDAECLDVVGGRLNEVVLSRLAPSEEGDLRPRAETIAASATGLMEPLRLVEVDDPQKTALLRSDSPRGREGSLEYYEMLVQATGSMTLRRYHASHQPGTRREQVPFSLTHETLARLAGDLTSAW